jgi:4-carboxymuconolactone decarboxylase
MRIDQPRIRPTTSADWDDDARPLLESLERGNGRLLNIFLTLARHPKLMKRWVVFANHVLFGSTLPARERELIILRTGYLCASGYEWAQHVAIARRASVTDDEIARIAEGPDAKGWSADDSLLLEATDELVGDKFISGPTWEALTARWNDKQLMDIVFTVGQYTLVSMALNSFGVQIEDDVERFPPELFATGRFPS